MKLQTLIVPALFLVVVWIGERALAQISTDPRLCGGYMRSMNGYIDFTFDENTAPPSVAQGKKFCMWTISPSSPTQQFRYNMTIRNVNLDCEGDRLAVNYFNESSDSTNLGVPQDQDSGIRNPFCIDEHEVWTRNHAVGTTMVVILYVEHVVYGKGFYLEWEEGWDSRITPPRPRNTYYSYGQPSVAPLPYFATSFLANEISTFGFIKANYTDGYTMEMFFEEIDYCEGAEEWEKCFNNTITVFSIQNDGVLYQEQQFNKSQTLTDAISSRNGFFIMVKGQDEFGAGGDFVLQFDTVRG